MLPKKTCTGCTACVSICPKSCISMLANADGFLYPEINTTECVNCNLCEKTCPVLKAKNEGKNNPPLTYAAKILNEDIRKNSSSGGIFTAVAEQITENNGIVYGAAFSENMSVQHIGVTEKSKLDLLRRSKYVQSSLNDCFHKIEEQLKSGCNVLFTGTPCQVSGLLSFLQQPYDNLITIDFVCHGVPSPKVLKEYIDYQEKAHKSKIKNINFRDKTLGWKSCSLRVDFENAEIYSQEFGKDPYMRAFLSNISLRSSCYDCKYKSVHHNSDLTIADYWGIDKINPSIDDDKGLSMVLVQSEKGRNIFDSVKDCLTITKTDVSEIYPYNPCLVKSVAEHNFRQYFFDKLGKKDFLKLVDSCLSPSYLTRLERKLLQLKGGEA